jgi:hypothetical protein
VKYPIQCQLTSVCLCQLAREFNFAGSGLGSGWHCTCLSIAGGTDADRDNAVEEVGHPQQSIQICVRYIQFSHTFTRLLHYPQDRLKIQLSFMLMTAIDGCIYSC